MWPITARSISGQRSCRIGSLWSTSLEFASGGLRMPVVAVTSTCRIQGAEEFRDAKRTRDGVGEKLQPLPQAKRQRGIAFGSGRRRRGRRVWHGEEQGLGYKHTFCDTYCAVIRLRLQSWLRRCQAMLRSMLACLPAHAPASVSTHYGDAYAEFPWGTLFLSLRLSSGGGLRGRGRRQGARRGEGRQPVPLRACIGRRG